MTTTTEKRPRSQRVAGPKLALVAQKPQMAEVIDIADRHQRSVVRDLTELMRRALNGEIIGLSYAVITTNHKVDGGLAGVFARDKLKASGALFGAAMRAAEDWEE